MSFLDDHQTYLGLPEEGRKAFLLQRFREHSYNPATMERLVVKEDPAFIQAILPDMYRAYHILSMWMLCRLADERGMDLAIDLLQDSGLLASFGRPEISRNPNRTEGNPLEQLYERLGPQFFVRLYQRGLVDLLTLYCWTQLKGFSDSHSFAQALVISYGQDPLRGPAVICELLLAKHKLAAGQGRRFLLFSELELILSLLEQSLDPDLLIAAMQAFSQELQNLAQPAKEAENIICCSFFCYFAAEHHPERQPSAVREIYFRWLTSHPSELARIHARLWPADPSDPPPSESASRL